MNQGVVYVLHSVVPRPLDSVAPSCINRATHTHSTRANEAFNTTAIVTIRSSAEAYLTTASQIPSLTGHDGTQNGTAQGGACSECR